MARIIQPPNTQTQTSHAITIHANGQMIGAINAWNPSQQMDVAAVFEFGQVTGPYGHQFGTPYEKVPQNITAMSIEIQRYDIYTSRMEEVFGTANLEMLSSDPGMANGGTGLFDVRERWTTPGGTNNYVVIYKGCWFTNIGRNHSTTGDRIVNVNATLEYTQKVITAA